MGKVEKQERVLKSAREVVLQIGVRRMTLEDVAQRAGLATSSLYYYFKNKEDLIRAVVTRELDTILEQIEQKVDNAQTPETKLRVVGRTMLEHAQKLSAFPGVRTREISWVLGEIESITTSFKHKVREIIKNILLLGEDAGDFEIEDLELTTFVIAAGIRGLSDSILEGDFPKVPIKGMDQMSRLLMFGLHRRQPNESNQNH